MNGMTAASRPVSAGFTLLEVMLVTALVSVLLMLAVPAYREQAMRAHRSVAALELLRAAGCQARLQAQGGSYDTGRCRPADSSRYAYRYETPGQAAATSFTLRAEPRNHQAADACGWLGIDEAGEQRVEHVGAGTARCWSGR